jgi:cyclase
MNKPTLRRIALSLLACALSLVAVAQTDADKIDVTTTEIKPGLHILMAPHGSNMALVVGEEGALLIDDHLKEVGEKLQQAISTITDKPVKYLVNTHWHFDHAGNNTRFGDQGTIIVAHRNVRQRLENGQVIKALGLDIPPAPAAALPAITFDQGLTFHWAGDTLEVVHLDPAHTDGDAVVYFLNQNVVHMGDLYFNDMYPFIDSSSGGSLSGMVAGVDVVLARIDGETVVIPGHGALSNKAEMQDFRNMLATVSERIAAMKSEGKSRQEVVAAKPTAEFDSRYGINYLEPDAWVNIVYEAP